MSRAWATQPSAKRKQLGPDKCPRVCDWYDPAGGRKRKTFGPGDRGRKLAERFCEKVSAELLTGTYQDRTKAGRADVADAYRRDRYPHLSADTRRLTQNALEHFARVTGLKRAAALDAAVVARYAAKRLTEDGRRGTTAPATVTSSCGT